MAQDFSPELVQQLSRNSTPYDDPLAKIDWSALDCAQYWLPQEAISLAGVPAFGAFDEQVRMRLSQYEFINFIDAGIWLEGLFMTRIAAAAQHTRADLTSLKYRLHELREEAGHSLMFVQVMEKSGLPLAAPAPRPRLGNLFGRYAPMESTPFWLAILLGEDIPDRLNRYIRRHAQGVCPAIVQVSTAHLIDEARHIAYARELLEGRIARMPAWRRQALAWLLRPLLDEFLTLFYFPQPAIYELAGLYPGKYWSRQARTCPKRRRFVRDCINPTLSMLQQRGIPLDWR